MAAVYDLNTFVRPANPPVEAQPDTPLDTLMMMTVMRRAARELIVIRPHTNSQRPSLTQAERDAITWEDAEWQ